MPKLIRNQKAMICRTIVKPDPLSVVGAISACPTPAVILAVVLILVSVSTGAGVEAQKGRGAAAFSMQSAAFAPGGDIPKKFTCDGPDVSPALTWTEPPANTQSFALIMDDPDAPMGTWVHWVVYDLPASFRQLSEGVPKVDELPGAGRQGVNDFPQVGYDGPCPPPGKPHRYFFKLYALAVRLNLKAGATKRDVEQAMKSHILAQAEIMGRYRR